MTLQDSLLGFAALAALITIIPGTDTALVLRYTLSQGRRHAYAAALGMISGAFVWGAAAATGVSALLTVSTVAYDIVRLAGAAYMVWLGLPQVARGAEVPDVDRPRDRHGARGVRHGCGPRDAPRVAIRLRAAGELAAPLKLTPQKAITWRSAVPSASASMPSFT